MSRFHIMPDDDARQHQASPACWCKPTPDNHHDIWAHHHSGIRVVNDDFVAPAKKKSILDYLIGIFKRGET